MYRFSRILKYSTGLGIGGYSAYVMHQNNWDVRNIGLIRFGRAAWIVGQISVDYKLSVSHLAHDDESEQALHQWNACHQRSAERLLKLCCQNGGVFIKVGQHIAALDYLVPKPYVDILSVLHNRGPRTSLKDIRAVLRNELGHNLEDLFTDFDPEPLGAASLAQVHRAKLRETGETVAVKVQHPFVHQHSVVDMATMEFLFGVVSKIFPSFDFRWLAAETRRNLPLELDFVNEGKNAETMAKIMSKYEWLKIPKVYWNFTTPRTLVMEYTPGEVITSDEKFLNSGIDTAELCHRIEAMYSEMIFLNGTIHCDPHPGNILVHNHGGGKNFDVVLLDHGLHTKLTDDFRETYCQMWMAVLNGDEQTILQCSKKMGIDISKHHGQLLSCMISAKPWSAVKRGLVNVPDDETRNKEKEELRRNASRYFNDISQILATVDRQLLLVMKTNDLIRSIAYTLNTDERRSFLTMSSACFEAVQRQRLRTAAWYQSIIIKLQNEWFYFKLYLYSFYLWFTWRGIRTLKQKHKKKLPNNMKQHLNNDTQQQQKLQQQQQNNKTSKLGGNGGGGGKIPTPLYHAMA